MADTLAGKYRPFLGHFRGALERRATLAGSPLEASELDAAAAIAARMPPFADSAEACGCCARTGCGSGCSPTAPPSRRLPRYGRRAWRPRSSG